MGLCYELVVILFSKSFIRGCSVDESPDLHVKRYVVALWRSRLQTRIGDKNRATSRIRAWSVGGHVKSYEAAVQ